MKDKIAGYLKVGHTAEGEVVVNYEDIEVDQQGVGHIVFSPRQARNLAKILNRCAIDAEKERKKNERDSGQSKAHGFRGNGSSSSEKS